MRSEDWFMTLKCRKKTLSSFICWVNGTERSSRSFAGCVKANSKHMATMRESETSLKRTIGGNGEKCCTETLQKVLVESKVAKIVSEHYWLDFVLVSGLCCHQPFRMIGYSWSQEIFCLPIHHREKPCAVESSVLQL